MSPGENVWPLIDELATASVGGRELSEQNLDELQQELRATNRYARDERRRQIIQIVAALSRLEVRMIDADGPLQAAVAGSVERIPFSSLSRFSRQESGICGTPYKWAFAN